MNTKQGAILVAVVLLGFTSVATANEKEIVSSLTLEQLVGAAMRENPQLKSMRAKWEAMKERPAQERTLPNPMLTYSGMDMIDGGTWPDTQEKRIMVQQEFPWFGKLGLKGKVAEKDAESMQREYEAMQREVIMMVKESYFDLYATQRALSITRGEEDVLKQMQKIAEAKYGVGEITQQDVLKAQAEISMLKARILELEQQQTVLKAKLNQLLNRRADSPLGLAVTEPQREFEFQADQLFGLAEKNRPEIKQARAQIERSQRERDLMKKEFFPDYRLGVEYRNVGVDWSDFSRSDNMVMFTVGIDLPIWQTKYRAGVREANKMIESTTAALEVAETQTSYDVQDASFKLLTARRSLDLYKSALVPQAEARFNASEAGYRTGKVDFLDLLESERFLLNARVMAVMAEGNVGMQLARLERAVGTDLKPSIDSGENGK
jgi:outer membrane protein TolC